MKCPNCGFDIPKAHDTISSLIEKQHAQMVAKATEEGMIEEEKKEEAKSGE